MSAPAAQKSAALAPEESPEDRYTRELAERDALRSAQSAHARERKLAKLARKDPVIRDLLEERRATGGALEQLRERLAATEAWLESARADARQAREDLAHAERELGDTREKLAQALKPKR